MFPARDYYDRIVRPTVQDFQSSNTDVRLGMLACMVLLHTVDHVYQNRETDPEAANVAVGRFNRTHSDRSEDPGSIGYAVVRGFANASKHARLTGRDLNQGFGSRDFHIASPSFAGHIYAGNTYAGDEVGGVTILWREGRAVNLTDAIEHTMRVLEAEFHELTAPPEETSGA
ncbi:hypothetical protein [Methylobacterium radiotolerans]|uniref:Uncharacterized protein n=1 Tax=Methylobacterium radiotolerans (strain ATCC 27329 / DSM 1819 / JCM 2831 / NBRC 15690 / NCIMB 10815 / 0-1) TaxID=426355 RepID=B1MAA0_METRJ|nr:hypothetical protein [Methylobacterium radiotolerans]ACB28425.1 hypothetical protein Mrad2831_6513 [Methylobacterium radiotolerans JCM 2831]GEN01537.1 hypothetical protein MRA01_60760 [Methylobacterium radiotolerans]